MNRVLKVIAYLAIAMTLSYFANTGDREFIKQFSLNIISLLATILAINIPTSTLIISEINRIKESINIKASSTFKELKHGLIMQILVLFSLFIIHIGCNYIRAKLPLCTLKINIISDCFTIAAFIYYLEVIYDLGIALFELLSFKMKDDK